MVISKDDFITIMDRLRARSSAVRIVNDAYAEASSMIGESDLVDFFDATPLFMSNEASLVKVLSVMFDDSDDFIGYWLYEMPTGGACVWDVDGSEIDISDSGKLYDFLTSGCGGD